MADTTKQDKPKAPAKQWKFKEHADRVTTVGRLGHLNHSTKTLTILVPKIRLGSQVGKEEKKVPVPTQAFLAKVAKDYPEVAAQFLVFE